MNRIPEIETIELREKYGELYETIIDDEQFVWRELSQKEYMLALATWDDDIDIEDYICQQCVLWPKDYDWDKCAAGVPTQLVSEIIAESCLDGNGETSLEKLNAYREEMTTFPFQMPCIIHEAFPELNIEEIGGWPVSKQLWYLSRAEYVIRRLRNLPLEYDLVEDETSEIREVKPPQNTSPQKPVEITGDKNANMFPELGQIERFMRGEL